jgi:exodeoxyribonuclease VII large subunit
MNESIPIMKSPLLQSLFDETENRPLTVSEVNSNVKSELERRFSSVWVEGEIVNFAAASSGHWYFTLNDGFSQLKAACYIRNNSRIRFKPFDGLQVRVRGKLTVYEPRGEYQLLVDTLEPYGEGALKIAFEQIKLKLGKERLFDDELKRPIPLFPKRVGVVTSPNGAAFFDILHVLSRRTRTVSIVLIPTRVQGEHAPEEIRNAIITANEFNRKCKETEKIDVLIVGRGGGSAEDLWAFNEEQLARTIRASAIPIISAVGHEKDFTIADYVADLRSPTPSAAAEVVAEREDNIEGFLRQRTQDLLQLMNYKLLESRTNLQELTLSTVFHEFPNQLRDWRFHVENCQSRINELLAEKLSKSKQTLEKLKISPIKLAGKVSENQTRLALLKQRQITAIKDIVDEKDEQLKIKMASLDALSPLSVLKRGFSLTQKENGEIIRDANQINVGENVQIRLGKGKIKAKISEKEENLQG